MAYTSDDYAHQELHRRTEINRIMFEQQMFLAGSWGADFHADLRPGDGEIVLHPHKRHRRVRDRPARAPRAVRRPHLVIADMTANLCVESTGRHAAERGYDVTFVRWQAFSDVDGHRGFGQDSFAVGDVNSTGHVAPYGGLPSDPSTRAPSQAS